MQFMVSGPIYAKFAILEDIYYFEENIEKICIFSWDLLRC